VRQIGNENSVSERIASTSTVVAEYTSRRCIELVVLTSVQYSWLLHSLFCIIVSRAPIVKDSVHLLLLVSIKFRVNVSWIRHSNQNTHL